MYRNSTPTLYLKVNGIDVTTFDDFLITFKCKVKNGEINKTKTDCDEVTSEYIKLTLTQEETLLLQANTYVKIQIQFFDNEQKKAIPTRITQRLVEEILNEQPRQWN